MVVQTIIVSIKSDTATMAPIKFDLSLLNGSLVSVTTGDPESLIAALCDVTFTLLTPSETL